MGGMNPFNRYGTRTPCLLASPLLNPGSVVRPDNNEQYPFDHCSIIRTLLDLFVSPDEYLTERDRLAPSLAPYLLSKPRRDLGPKQLPYRMPGKDDPTMRGKRGQVRGGCHSVGKLMEFGDQGFEEQGHVDHSAVEQALGFVKLTTTNSRTGYPSHVSYRQPFKENGYADNLDVEYS